MTARSRTRSRRGRTARRFGVSLVMVAGFTMATTSTMALANSTAPAESTTSVVGLTQGSTGPAVTAVQQKLIDLGYYVAGGADGVFGPGTSAALEVFQRQNGLNPTGVVTENTARYLGLEGGVNAAPAAPATPTTPAPDSYVGLSRGMTGESVRQLQLAIQATGLVIRGGADGTYGASTERAVKLVQRVNGLPETGVMDAATASALGLTGSASSPTTPAPAGTELAVGSRGDAVKRIQQLLIQAGVSLPGGADGIFGPQTERAVRSFQQLRGLTVTGRVDASTDSALAAGGSTAPSTSTSEYVGLQAGSSGPAVVTLQQAIIDKTGLVIRGGVDGVYGQSTRTAVILVQRVNGYAETGVVNEATARVLGLLGSSGGSTPTPSGGGNTATGYATYDEHGSRVVALQQALLNAGMQFTGGADGVFGSGTAGAIMRFQQARGLRVTGKVDAATAGALGLQPMSAPAPAAPVTITLQAKPLANGPCWYGDTYHAPRGSGRVHLGVDIGAAEGTPLQAVVTGRVTQVYRDQSLAGNGIKIALPNGTYFFYAHLASIADGIDVGVPVTAGQVIGYMGHTGNAGITHLHFEVHPNGGPAVNPFPIMQSVGAC